MGRTQGGAIWLVVLALAVACEPSRGGGRVGPTTAAGDAGLVALQILAINDLHGHLAADGFALSGRAVGGAAVLAAHLHLAQMDSTPTFIVHAGDLVGASPAISALLQDEPTLDFFAMLGNEHCRGQGADPRCNLLGTLGNHEFDEGRDELLRLLRGGDHVRGPFLARPYRGAGFPYVCANVLELGSRAPLVSPALVREVGGVRLGFIGAVVRDTPSLVFPEAVAGLRFLDEASAINEQAERLRAQGVRALVVLIHEGGEQAPYAGPTRGDAALSGHFADLVSRLNGEIDVVVSGHAHAFTNALLPNAAGAPVLVTQALSYGRAYADIELWLDRNSGDVVRKTARILPTYADAVTPDPRVEALVAAADAVVQDTVRQPVATAAVALPAEANVDGESALGNLIADAHRAAMGADVGLMNQGGIRADLPAGLVTWGDLFAIQPFGNPLVRVTLSGQELVALLEQQWPLAGRSHRLQVSGLRYVWDPERPRGSRVLSVELASGAPLRLEQRYTVAVNGFLASGANGFDALVRGDARVVGDSDLEALVQYLSRFKSPFGPPSAGRVRRAAPMTPGVKARPPAD